MLTVLLTESYSAKNMDFMNIIFKQYECTHKHTAAPETKYLRVLICKMLTYS